ncbi:hypothetical protein ECANGB1_1213 [Enterospora canceri]|uniref:Uncharacterized protein n=1 Tax=Enterospora canceri TaxID=1081671 RepID=A0A1Y1S6I0_9MICR|nr:hypothetical protein ECANGB1_1213 [Enterospora canceri]
MQKLLDPEPIEHPLPIYRRPIPHPAAKEHKRTASEIFTETKALLASYESFQKKIREAIQISMERPERVVVQGPAQPTVHKPIRASVLKSTPISPQEVVRLSPPKEVDKESNKVIDNVSDKVSVQDSAETSQQSTVSSKSYDEPGIFTSMWYRIIGLCCCISTIENEITYTTDE